MELIEADGFTRYSVHTKYISRPFGQDFRVLDTSFEIMPRILSRNATVYNRRKSTIRYAPGGVFVGGESTSSKSSENSVHLVDRRSCQSLVSSSTLSSPTFSRRPHTGALSPALSPRAVHDRSSDSSCGSSDLIDEYDSWGQFVDTAEAEEEIIRHSKILSKRYALY